MHTKNDSVSILFAPFFKQAHSLHTALATFILTVCKPLEHTCKSPPCSGPWWAHCTPTGFSSHTCCCVYSGSLGPVACMTLTRPEAVDSGGGREKRLMRGEGHPQQCALRRGGWGYSRQPGWSGCMDSGAWLWLCACALAVTQREEMCGALDWR